MSRFIFKMPDLGEGTVEAEVVEWKVKVGEAVSEDQIIAEVMTDKAAVEIPSPVNDELTLSSGVKNILCIEHNISRCHTGILYPYADIVICIRHTFPHFSTFFPAPP